MDENEILDAFKMLGIESEDERKRILAQGYVFVLVDVESPRYSIADNKTSKNC